MKYLHQCSQCSHQSEDFERLIVCPNCSSSCITNQELEDIKHVPTEEVDLEGELADFDPEEPLDDFDLEDEEPS